MSSEGREECAAARPRQRIHLGTIEHPDSDEIAAMTFLPKVNCYFVLRPDSIFVKIWDWVLIVVVGLAMVAQAQHHRWQARFVECSGCWIYADLHDDNPHSATRAFLDNLLTFVLLTDILVDARTGYVEEVEARHPDDPECICAHTRLGK